jgi:hypothetical protein
MGCQHVLIKRMIIIETRGPYLDAIERLRIRAHGIYHYGSRAGTAGRPRGLRTGRTATQLCQLTFATCFPRPRLRQGRSPPHKCCVRYF